MSDQTTIIEVCNMALSHVRGLPITGLNDTTEESRLCKRFAQATMEQTLSMIDWGFARRVVRPTVLTSSLLRPGWTVVMARPADAVVIRSLSDSIHGAYNPRTKFEVGQDQTGAAVVYASALPETLVYTSKTWTRADPMFLSAWSWRLAWQLAYPLTANPDLQKQTLQIATQELSQAQAISLNQGILGPSDEHEMDPDWIRDR